MLKMGGGGGNAFIFIFQHTNTHIKSKSKNANNCGVVYWFCIRLPPRRLEFMGRKIESRVDCTLQCAFYDFFLWQFV
jgi:hypothetical protein